LLLCGSGDYEDDHTIHKIIHLGISLNPVDLLAHGHEPLIDHLQRVPAALASAVVCFCDHTLRIHPLSGASLLGYLEQALLHLPRAFSEEVLEQPECFVSRANRRPIALGRFE